MKILNLVMGLWSNLRGLVLSVSWDVLLNWHVASAGNALLMAWLGLLVILNGVLSRVYRQVILLALQGRILDGISRSTHKVMAILRRR